MKSTGDGQMLKVGFGERVITPAVGVEMPGMLQKRYGQSIHDDLVTNAIVVDDGEAIVAFVGVDALSVRRSMVVRARERIKEETGIPGEHVMIAASHTHNGGPTCDVFLSEPDTEYCARVAQCIADAVIDGWRQRCPAVLRMGSGEQYGIAFNRRFRMRDGSERTHPGKGNPDTMEPAGPIDPEVGVIGAFDAETDAFLGCFVNYTCHCTLGVGGTGFSADYPYYLRRSVCAVMGDADAVVVFGNGACGDVTQVNNQRDETAVRESGEAWGRYVGNCIAGEVIKILSEVSSVSDVVVAGASQSVLLSPRELVTDEVDRCRSILEEDPPKGDWERDRILAREIALLAEMNEQEPAVEAEIQALRIGEAVIVSSPAEYFCEFGLQIKERLGQANVYVVELANGCIGYVPNAEQVLKGEGYEPMTCRSSKLAPDAGVQIADASVSVAQRLRRTRCS